MDGGYGYRVAYSEGVKLVYIGVYCADGVHFINREHDRLLAAEEHIRHLLIGGGHSGIDIADEDYDGRRLDRGEGLIPHKGQYLAVGLRLDTAGIDDVEGPARPFALRVKAVSRHARRVLDYAYSLSCKLIEKAAFADVRPAYYRYERFHLPHFLFIFLSPSSR